MRKNYISPEMTVKTFSKAVQTADEGTSAIMQAKLFFNENTEIAPQNILVME